jgi:hypothetical protein
MRIQTMIATLITILSAILMISCAPLSILAPTEIPTPAPLPPLLPIPPSPIPQSSSNASPEQTSAANPERWIAYENALAAAFLSLPDLPVKGLCEWEILGQKEHEVYVWAMCQVADSAEGQAMSAPAVIVLAENGNIEKVETPGDGSQYAEDIRNMFPLELQEKMLSQSITSTDEMWAHIQFRHNNPEPPLIAGSGTALP